MIHNVRGPRLLIWLAVISIIVVHLDPVFALNSTDTTQRQDDDQPKDFRTLRQFAAANAPMALLWIIWLTLLGKNAVPILAIATVSGLSDVVLAGITALPFLAMASVIAIPFFMAIAAIVFVFLAVAGIVALPCIALFGIVLFPFVAIASFIALGIANAFVLGPFASCLHPILASYEPLQPVVTKLARLKAGKKSCLASASNESVFHVFTTYR